MAVIVGVAWLAPLMLDQLVLFADQQQIENAAAARTLMPVPAILLAAGAAAVGVRGQPAQATVAALPLVAVLLALALPETAVAIVAYGIAAPAALGAVLAATLPVRGRAASLALLLAVGAAAVLALVIGSVLGVLATLGGFAWWALSRRPRGRPGAAPDASALD